MLVSNNVVQLFKLWNWIQIFSFKTHPFCKMHRLLWLEILKFKHQPQFHKPKSLVQKYQVMNMVQPTRHKVFMSYKKLMQTKYALIGSDVLDFRKNMYQYQFSKTQLYSWLNTSRKAKVVTDLYKTKFLLLCLLQLNYIKVLPLITKFISLREQFMFIKIHSRKNTRLKIYKKWNKSLLFTNTSPKLLIQPLTNLLYSFKNNLKPLQKNIIKQGFLSSKKAQKRVTSNLYNFGTKPGFFLKPKIGKFIKYTRSPHSQVLPILVRTNLACKSFTLSNHVLQPQWSYSRKNTITKIRENNIHVTPKLMLGKTTSKHTLSFFKNSLAKALKPVLTTNAQPISITPKFFKKFILNNSGVFLTYQNNLLHRSANFNNKSQFKKKLFSFIYPEFEKKAIFIRKKKKTLASILQNFSKKLNLTKNFSFKNLNKLNLNNYISYTHSIVKQNLFNYNSSYTDILSPVAHKTKGVDNRYMFAIRDVKLSRVRFKPGYQRLWRQARQALQASLHVNFQYQKRLTKYITRYYTQVNRYLFAASESSASNIILYSLLVPNYKTILSFQTKNFFYINGQVLHNVKQLVAPNDIIQIIVSLWYYIMFRWLHNWTLTRIKKFKRLVYRKGLASKYQLMKTKKRASRYTPLWIFNTRYDNVDIKPYLEVDYLTLSVFLLHDPYLLVYYSPDNLPDMKLSIYRMYNWKYIT